MVQNCVNQVNVLTKEHNVTISVSKDNDIPEFLFNYDGIERALTNLLSNAIKYSPQNSTIRVNISKKTTT